MKTFWTKSENLLNRTDRVLRALIPFTGWNGRRRFTADRQHQRKTIAWRQQREVSEGRIIPGRSHSKKTGRDCFNYSLSPSSPEPQPVRRNPQARWPVYLPFVLSWPVIGAHQACRWGGAVWPGETNVGCRVRGDDSPKSLRPCHAANKISYK